MRLPGTTAEVNGKVAAAPALWADAADNLVSRATEFSIAGNERNDGACLPLGRTEEGAAPGGIPAEPGSPTPLGKMQSGTASTTGPHSRS